MLDPIQKAERKAQLLGSLLLFTQVFYQLRTGREFRISEPIGRMSHNILICRALTKVLRGETKRLIINIPPRYGKTEHLINFCAWAMAHNPQSNIQYISYSASLAALQTQTIRDILQLPHYRDVFDISISKDSSAKDNFTTEQGGTIYAAGSGGTITGRGAGIKNFDGFGGLCIIDDIHKPEEVTSDTIREKIKNWWKGTLLSRVNSPEKTPIVFIGQRLHEDDVAANLIDGYDGSEWETLILPALDGAKNALDPSMHDKEKLLNMQEFMPYEFASQYQQNPQPSGGGIFKPEWFVTLDKEPDIYATFITADTSETSKTYNDASVFSLWGVYKIKHHDIDTGIIGLHWMDCHVCWVEPKDLEAEFLQFYREASLYKVKPSMAVIEQMSTGTTLVSLLSKIQGINVIPIKRVLGGKDPRHASKIDRFLNIQPYVAQRYVSLPTYGSHTATCIDHMKKITANDSHRHDDIADTLADAVMCALVDKILIFNDNSKHARDNITSNMAQAMRKYLPQANGQNRWQR